MGAFDFLRKNKPMAKINWHTEDRLIHLPIDFIIKKEVLADSHAIGVIYIQGNPYNYSYGNLSEIIPHSILMSVATMVQCSIRDDGAVLWNIMY